MDLQGEDVDEDCGLDVVEEEELGPPPDQEVVRHVRELVLTVQYSTEHYNSVKYSSQYSAVPGSTGHTPRDALHRFSSRLCF